MKFFSTLFFFSFISHSILAQNAAHHPVVFVHGFLGSGDTWAGQVQRLYDNGYTKNEVWIFDWNTVGGNRAEAEKELETLIRKALNITGKKVDLVGHSAGGGLCYAFLQDSAHAGMVERYIHIGSSPLRKNAGPDGRIPTLVIQSAGDKVARGLQQGDAVLVSNLPDQDHYQVAAGRDCFESLYPFLQNGKKPLPEKKSKNHVAATVSISGRLVTLGDNQPVAGTVIRLQCLDSLKGLPMKGFNIKSIQTDSTGYWVCKDIPAGAIPCFTVCSSAGREVQYFLPPLRQDRSFLYLRCFPRQGLPAMMLKGIPSETNKTVLGVYSGSRAMIAGRDSLTLNNIAVLHEDMASAAKTLVACFIWDDGDGISSGKPHKALSSPVFLGSLDYVLPPSRDGLIRVRLNGQTTLIPQQYALKNICMAIFD